MAAKGPKKSGGGRSDSALRKEAASIATSLGNKEKRNIVIWPEWNDADLNTEKWDAVHRVDKKAEKGKSPVVQHYFDDPEARVEFFACGFKAVSWKRPQEYILDKIPVIIDPEHCTGFDLISCSEAAHENELIRHISSQISSLFLVRRFKGQTSEENVPFDGTYTYRWRPWEHIYMAKLAGKGPNAPTFNPFGKYAVKLYWMGCWRKIIVDDSIPFDDNDKPLLPCTNQPQELWPMLLTKALLKIASIDFGSGSPYLDFGDFNVIECLTGWVPETIPLQCGYQSDMWNLLKSVLPEFKLPDPEKEKESASQIANDIEEAAKPEEIIKDAKVADTKNQKDTKKDKSDKKDKKDNKEKAKEKSIVMDENAAPQNPELIVLASYCGPPKFPMKVSALTEMADASERLRQTGFSHQYTHSVLLQQTRSCPLEPPPPQEIVPNWKLIRPRKKKGTPSDMPEEEEIEKPIQSIEVFSPFMDYKVSHMPIPQKTKRPKSALERHSTKISPTDPIEEEEKPKLITSPSPPIQREATPPLPSATPAQPPVDLKNGTDDGKKKQPVANSNNTKVTAPSPDKNAKKKGPSTPTGTATVKDASKEDSARVSEPSQGSQEAPISEIDKTEVTKRQSLWMDYEIFARCFRMITIYHKTETYQFSAKDSDLTKVSTPSPTRDKKGAAGAAAPQEEKSPMFLFVDSLKVTEIIASFNSLCRWPAERSMGLLPSKTKSDSESTSESPLQNSSVTFNETIQPGLLVAEPYSWKTVVTGQPILRLRTTGSKAAVMTLQPGRHLLRLHTNSPLGYHIHFLSATPFVFGDEDKIMNELVKESARFLNSSQLLAKSLGKCLTSLSDTEKLKEAWDEYISIHCPYLEEKNARIKRHFSIWNEALFLTVQKFLKEDSSNYRTPEMAFAWRVLTQDCTSTNILGQDLSHSRPVGLRTETSNTPRPPVVAPPPAATAAAGSVRGSARDSKMKKRATEKNKEAEQHADRLANEAQHGEKEKDPRIEFWINRYHKEEITVEEQVAATRIQKVYKGHWVRSILKARRPNLMFVKVKEKGEYTYIDLNMRCAEWLQKAWNVIESKAEEFGLQLFRNVFRKDSDMLERYAFHKDEWNKISYQDFSGTYPEKAHNSWFVLFKEVFHVSEELPEVLCVPKLYVPFQAAMVRVVDNDTGQELPKVFNKVSPHIYRLNRKGYTFMAEARTSDSPIPAGRWRLRLIGSASPLPAPAKPETISAPFDVHEIRDYYVPKNNLFLRYNVKNVSDDQVAVVQLSTSNSDVQFKITVYDNDIEVASTQGKGHAVIPAVLFHRTQPLDDETSSKRSSSRASARGGGGGGKADKKGKRGQSPATTLAASVGGQEETVHKYVIEASILNNSWPLTERNWTFVTQLKEQEKNELKVFLPPDQQPVQPEIPPEVSNRPTSGGKSKGKGAKGAKAGAKDKLSRPPSQQFDIGRPHWILRVVSESSDTLQVRKDTERADQIRSMKRAWEEAEPGRAAKAVQSRAKFLGENLVDIEQPEKVDQQPTSDEDTLLNEPPPPHPPTQILKELDIDQFKRRTAETPQLLDEVEEAKRMIKRREEMSSYREHREYVEKRRKDDRVNRNKEKISQIEMYTRLQMELEKLREVVDMPREAYRQKLLEAERLRQEEIAAREAALSAELEKENSGKKSPKGKKGKGSAKGKKGKK